MGIAFSPAIEETSVGGGDIKPLSPYFITNITLLVVSFFNGMYGPVNPSWQVASLLPSVVSEGRFNIQIIQPPFPYPLVYRVDTDQLRPLLRELNPDMTLILTASKDFDTAYLPDNNTWYSTPMFHLETGACKGQNKHAIDHSGNVDAYELGRPIVEQHIHYIDDTDCIGSDVGGHENLFPLVRRWRHRLKWERVQKRFPHRRITVGMGIEGLPWVPSMVYYACMVWYRGHARRPQCLMANLPTNPTKKDELQSLEVVKALIRSMVPPNEGVTHTLQPQPEPQNGYRRKKIDIIIAKRQETLNLTSTNTRFKPRRNAN